MRHRTARFALSFLLLLGLRLATPPSVRGQNAPTDQAPTQPAPAPADHSSSSDPATLFPHSESSRFWISGQANIITQWHPAFHSPYQGPNSLSPEAQDATSRLLTLLLGIEVSGTTEFLCDIQESGGHGIGEALGLAG